ncbi:anaphase-promoting complex subunit 1 [Fusarium oxysporum f. sp. lycopersici MN25]|uniref:Negative regulator of mitosis n=1 Tax=Fusarium oxysporum f. sp. cepae TaxID=396571 RepID=A0A3L6NYT2_FUSOX|nr:anaphase-promoting complex subunit 1 [Fusarium oxysporum f. sp. lycopersici MN25]RKK24746.1 Negative regulator of mitosis [Fusarium oxysporum f. sp. cepae]RKK33584.1 Negative regulator of mitosis [Fusarium oxysporum f. sp. cepae]
MATVKSLGLHQPSGLQHAINEQLLPPNPSSTSYTWDISTEDRFDGDLEDEILSTEHCVIWCRGGIFRKTFRFELEKEPVIQALLAYFPASKDDKSTQEEEAQSDQRPALSKALVVFLKTQAHIYFLSGTSHIVHMPFEVETAFAGPIGVIIQRKQKAESVAPISLKFPRVPPNSFVSSQLTAFNSSQLTAFSVEGLGKPKALPLRLSSTLDNLWEAPLEQPESRWPRLVSLTDPLLELGLVVTNQEAQNGKSLRQTAAKKLAFLDSAEEVLHVEEIKIPGALTQDLSQPLIIAVTINRETSEYTVWRLTYLQHEDRFLARQKDAKSKTARRRSSMPPAFASTPGTPVQPNLRESFGAPLPGKRPRKSERLEKPMIDLVSSLEQQDKEGSGVARRSSRRVSSMLARADLSASHERAILPDQPLLSSHVGARRHESQGSHARLSANYAHQIHPSLSSLLAAPFYEGLDEGFHNMGLDDHEFDGLQHEILFTKLHSVPMNNSNVRYSDQPARTQTKVFILVAPPFAIDGHDQSQLLIGIQDATERRLQLLTLELGIQRGTNMGAKPGKKNIPDGTTVVATVVDRRHAQNVVDSCKLMDGDHSAILILSESMDGRHELSTQAPWSVLTKISLSLLFVDNTRSLQYRGRVVDRDVTQRKSEVIDFSNGSIVGVRHPRQGGIVDVVDAEGRLHELRIQLEPRSPHVRRVLDVCRSILPHALGEHIFAGWLHCMQWIGGHDETSTDIEWSAMTILLLSLFLSLGRTDTKPFPKTRQLPRRRRHPSGSFGSIKESEDWGSLEKAETSNSLGCPTWMMNGGWQWALDEDGDDSGDENLSTTFISKHISMAKEYMVSILGETAFGAAGYMPTALGKSMESRRKVAVDVFMGLHLLLEEEKLDIMTPEFRSPGRADLRVIMCQIARWLKWPSFIAIYEAGIQEDVDQSHDSGIFVNRLCDAKLTIGSDLNLRPAIPQPPVRPDVVNWIQSRLTGERRVPYITPADVYYAGSQLSEAEKSQDRRWESILPRTLMFKQFFKFMKPSTSAVQMVEAMRDAGITPLILDTLPEATLSPLRDAISLCQPHPPTSWSKDLLELVDRRDISLILAPGKQPKPSASKILTPTHNATWDYKLLCQSVDESNSIGYDEGEGTERQAIIRSLFKEDRRLNEAQDLLSTHKARLVRLDPHPGWPESEYLEKQKELVTRIATGTLAIPAGRALLYYSLRYPLITQKFHIGGFNLNCIVKPTNTTVGVDKSQFSEEKVCWGFFHQGVAAGLAISPQAQGIDTSWILYNKPGQDLNNRHAGFLLALGLNGHLKDVAKWVAFKYLTPKHTMTSIGLLLGLAASYMGTMDSLITRLLSVHATRMLPRGAAELNLSPLTQTSGIMGIGLLYANSQHRRMSEIMLSEIEHIDEEDEEEPLRSECYRLAAGFALGFINLGKGNDLKGLHDMRLTEKLISHATTTKNIEIVHILDRAAAGAVMALALIYMKSEDQIVARKIDIPNSVLQFDYIRPDILLLRTLTKNLIMWSKIEPTFAWIRKNLPRPYRSQFKLQSTTKLQSTDMAFHSIVAGLCFSIALRFSGSASPKVRDLLLYYLDQFMRIAQIPSTASMHPNGTPPYDEELTRTNARMCQDIVAISASIVMAGTGDIPVLRRLRALHGRDDPETPYGSHLAAHLAIGALFLGCGTATFGTSNLAIASLLVAFYPIFPTSVMDNRSHLQALRHFWVLATEQRCLVTKDVLTGQPITVPVQIRMRKNTSTEPVLNRTAPCILPPIDQIASLSTTCGPQFWDVELDFSNPEVRAAFQDTQSLYLRRRPPREGAFASTLRALGRDEKGKDPLEWVFGLEGLRGISYAERAVVLERGDDTQHSGSAVDARLEMAKGIAEGTDRERLEGARLLFEWASVRDRLRGTNMFDSQETITESHVRREVEREDDQDATVEDEGVWWMRDSVIENLKGMVWLASREGEH